MSDQVVDYAPGMMMPAHSRAGVGGFICSLLAACGVVLIMILIARPIPGPIGGLIRNTAILFGAALLGLWLCGITFGIVGLLERNRIRTFPTAALVVSGATPILFGLMILLMY